MRKDHKLQKMIAGCRKGKETSQMALYGHFYGYGMSICLRYARSRESALEMLNDGFLKVFLKIDQYDSEMSFKPWLRRVLVNAAIDHYRKYELVEREETWLPEQHPATYNEALDQLEFEDMLTIIHQLPAGYRVVFNLYVIEGLSHAEIAEKLGINIGTSKSNLSKARKKIKELLSHSFGVLHKTEQYG